MAQTVWTISDGGAQSVPDEELGRFCSDQAYVVVAAPGDGPSAKQRLYLWAGQDAPKDTKSAAAKHATELMKTLGATYLRQQQGEETADFKQLFAGFELVPAQPQGAAAQPSSPAAEAPATAAAPAPAADEPSAEAAKEPAVEVAKEPAAEAPAQLGAGASQEEGDEEDEEEQPGAAGGGKKNKKKKKKSKQQQVNGDSTAPAPAAPAKPAPAAATCEASLPKQEPQSPAAPSTASPAPLVPSPDKASLPATAAKVEASPAKPSPAAKSAIDAAAAAAAPAAGSPAAKETAAQVVEPSNATTPAQLAAPKGPAEVISSDSVAKAKQQLLSRLGGTLTDPLAEKQQQNEGANGGKASTYLAHSAKAWGGVGAGAPPAAPAPVEVKIKPGEQSFGFEELKDLRVDSGIDMTCKEAYLSDAEFEKVFGKDRAAWKALPAWRQQLGKKQVGLW